MPGDVDLEVNGESLGSPLLWLAASFALGIALAGARPAGLPGALLLAGCAACLLGGLIALELGWRRVALVLALLGFATAGAAAAKLFPYRFPPSHLGHRTEASRRSELARVEGWIASTPSRTPYGLQFDLEVTALDPGPHPQPVSGRVRVRVERPTETEKSEPANPKDLHYGDTIRAPVRLRRPRLYRNPGSFDFRYWMESIQDVAWLGTIRSPLLIEKLAGPPTHRASAFVEKLRRHLFRGIDRMYPPWSLEGREGAVLKAVLLGERASIDSDTIENFRKAGLYHLLVIAGLHVGLLAWLARMFLGAFRLRESARTLLVLAFLAGYSFLVEQRAPTLRATLMIFAYLVTRLLYRRHALSNAVGLAGLALLLARPPWLFEAGFELSFSAALLIAALAVPILERTSEPYLRALRHLEDAERDVMFEPRAAQFRLDVRAVALTLSSRSRFLARHPAAAERAIAGATWCVLWCVNILLFSAILQIGLLLPMAETFHRVSLAGVPLNALAIPVMTLLLACALPAVFLSAAVPSLAPGLGKVLSPVMKVLFALTDIPHLPAWLSYRVPAPPEWVAWGFALSAFVAAWALGWRARRQDPKTHGQRFDLAQRPEPVEGDARATTAGLISTGVFAALIALHPFPPRLPRGVLEVTTLDCGGGDAVFVVLPDQSTLLIDACGGRPGAAQAGAYQARRWDPGEEIVSPYLWSRGLERLDALVLTEDRPERVSGHAAVVRNFVVGEFWHGPATAGGPARTADASRELIDQARERGIPVRELAAGETLARGGVSIRVLWPPRFDFAHRPERSIEGRRPGPPNLSPSSSSAPGDNSIVLRLSQGEGSILLPGEINARVEEELARQGARTDSDLRLSSLVLKAARHASKSSCLPEFLSQVSPQVAIVAAEESDPIARPYPETLARLRRAGARVFRTDRDGAVRVELRGATLTVHTFQAWAGEVTAGFSGRTSAGGATFKVR